MKKLIFSLFIIFCGLTAMASPNTIIKKAVARADISQTALIGVSFKEVDSNKVLVNYNDKTPMSMASVQKIVTTIPALNTLGFDYEFKTQILKNNKTIYIKLGADPYFTSSALRNMVKNIGEKELDAIYIDDTIVDRIEWGEGWQWDNTLNPLMPKFSAYNIDGNHLKLIVNGTTQGCSANVFTNTFYPLVVENNVITGKITDVKLFSQDYMKPDFIEVSGIVNGRKEFEIPINDLKKFFILRLKDGLKDSKVAYYGKFEKSVAPTNASVIAEEKHSIKDAVPDILINSNNMISETLFKIAGGKYKNSTGTFENAVDMFKDYYNTQNIDIDGIKITDASGVSKNNLLNPDFVTEVLVKDYNKTNSIKEYMATPGKGTLTNRMLYLKDNLIAKTGTLQNVSAIAGYLTAQNGKVYAFCIVVNDPRSKSSEKKAFEEYILRTAYEGL